MYLITKNMRYLFMTAIMAVALVTGAACSSGDSGFEEISAAFPCNRLAPVGGQDMPLLKFAKMTQPKELLKSTRFSLAQWQELIEQRNGNELPEKVFAHTTPIVGAVCPPGTKPGSFLPHS